jgi:tetraprenyl-beta-curcumene synthase
VHWWRRRAETIPDPYLRTDALHVLDQRRGHLDGAALFWILPRRRDRRLLRALVTYELIQDYLDNVSERAAAVNGGDGSQLYLALADAVDPGRPLTDHYYAQPWGQDGGFLAALIETFRTESGCLPSIDAVRPRLIRDASLATVLATNHLTGPDRRDAALRRWVEANFSAQADLRWYELAAAGSGWITTHTQLALAAEPVVTPKESDMTFDAYFPWCTLSLTMLDSYADLAEDELRGHHSYFGHYGNVEEGVDRLCASIEQAASSLLSLPDGERHGLMLACMIALYLSKDSVRTPAMRSKTQRIIRAGGKLSWAIVPIARVWRVCNSQRSTT